VQNAGGIWELDDLAGYRIVERTPTRVSYRGAQITCAPLPSSGGLVLTEVLQILERYPLAALTRPQRDHLVVEALRRGYQDRARYMGDPDFVTPPAQLSTSAYAAQRAESIKLDKATPSAELDRLYPVLPEGDNTTHFSIVDAQGNRVAATLSVNLPFGAGVIAGDTGVLLNDEMNDFALRGSTGNAYGLSGGAANAVAPGKRPLSSMTPAFVEDERGVLVIGTPGGSRIISMVLLSILEYVDSAQLDLERVVGATRFHHQYLPDRVQFEPPPYAMSPEWVAALKAMGHTVEQGSRPWGNMQAVFVDKRTGMAEAYNDPRGKAGMLF
jgi:gamma-glutamyltranspeptidase/glutathione hydrolase